MTRARFIFRHPAPMTRRRFKTQSTSPGNDAARHCFLAPGNYRVRDTIYIWPAVRLIGYGAERPKIILPENSAGFGNPSQEKMIFYFAGGRPRSPSGKVPDANPGTFYSALANLDIEFKTEIPAPSRPRTLCATLLPGAHDFQLGDALAGIHEGGNVMKTCIFFGGTHGIWTSQTVARLATHARGLLV